MRVDGFGVSIVGKVGSLLRNCSEGTAVAVLFSLETISFEFLAAQCYA